MSIIRFSYLGLFLLLFACTPSKTDCDCAEKKADTEVEEATPTDESETTTTTETMSESTPKKVTGIGGVFFKADDPTKMKEWYSEHLGFNTDQYGTMFQSRDHDNPDQVTYLQWSAFDSKTTYFNPSEKEFMINYRVADLEALAEELKAAGVEIVDEIETYEYGKFLHIMDPEGNKIELWEPIDPAFDSDEAGAKTK